MDHSALQHERAPRPLPLFLELVREAGTSDPHLARAALKGLSVYAKAPRTSPVPPRPEAARVDGACLRDHGGEGPTVVLIPSLINPPGILDLDEQVSLAFAIAGMGRRVLLLDWGEAQRRSGLSVAGHVERLLLPLLATLERPPALVGYCLGGTMALAAANLSPVERVVTLAAPWHFTRYPDDSRAALLRLWQDARATANALGALPMEVLQASFWSLDPARTVAKYAELAELDPASAEARRFVALEDWANEGEPLPVPAARELIEDFFGGDLPGGGEWTVGGRAVTSEIPAPVLHFTAARDRITPAATAPAGPTVELPAGHVGMVVGRARTQLHGQMADFLRLAAGRRQG